MKVPVCKISNTKSSSGTLNSVKEYFSAKEAAIYLGISISTLYKLVHERKVPHYKPSGKLLRFSKTDLKNFISANRIPARSEKQLLTNY